MRKLKASLFPLSLLLTLNMAANVGLSHEELTIASWNIQWLGDGSNDCALKGNIVKESGKCHGSHIRREKDYQLLQGYAKLLNADIVSFQEVENIKAAHRVFPAENWDIYISRRRPPRSLRQLTGFAVRRGADLQIERQRDLIFLNGRVRNGVDLEITHHGQSLALLSVHLKSRCSSNRRRNLSCRALFSQIVPLKKWMVSKHNKNIPFIVAGDWNRRINVEGDYFWHLLNKNNPREFNLTRTGIGNHQQCWEGLYHEFIDHIVIGNGGKDLVDVEFEEIVYKESHSLKHKLSDHCPITAKLRKF